MVHIVGNHIMVTALPPDCPTLPDGRVLMAALVGMEGDKFGLMFLNGIEVCCTSGSSCNVHLNVALVEESFHRCVNCALLWRRWRQQQQRRQSNDNSNSNSNSNGDGNGDGNGNGDGDSNSGGSSSGGSSGSSGGRAEAEAAVAAQQRQRIGGSGYSRAVAAAAAPQ